MEETTKNNGEVSKLIKELQNEGNATIVYETSNERVYLIYVPNGDAQSYSLRLIEKDTDEDQEYRIIKDKEIPQHVKNYITSANKIKNGEK